jgi:hypothetical protein
MREELAAAGDALVTALSQINAPAAAVVLKVVINGWNTDTSSLWRARVTL